MKLGRKPPHPPEHAHHKMRLAPYLPAQLPPPPEACSWAGAVSEWILGKNDEEGDCAIVAPANALLCWSSNVGGPVRLEQSAIDAAYTWAGGFDGTPGDESDGGCVISDVLEGWSTRDVGIGGHRVDAFAEIEHSDHDMIRRAILLFGVAIVGVELPRAAQAWGTAPWPSVDGSHGLSGDFAPGSWGGHCVALVGYDVLGVTAITWGRAVVIPWSTLGCYLTEAWCVVSRDWLSANGVSPSGVDVALMRADLAALRDQG